MKEIRVLTPEEVLPGFALAGVHHQALEPQQVWAALEELCAKPEVGVVVIDARLAEVLDPVRLQELLRHWAGVLVTLPAPAGLESAGEDDLQRLVRRALGYHVRIES